MSTLTLERPVTAPAHVEDAAVAVYPNHMEAEIAIKELQRSGYDMKKMSIVGQDYHTEEHVVGYYNMGDRMKAWGKSGAFWGGLWGLMFGGAFLIPGLGAVLLAGPLVAAVVGTLEGALLVGGVSAIGAALVSMGVPQNSAVEYETEISAGRFILILHGTHREIGRARAILEVTNHLGIAEHTAIA